MKDAESLVEVEHESFVACYRALAEAAPGGAVRDDLPGVFAFVTGLPLPMFNGCILGLGGAGDAKAAATALDWLVDQGFPHTLWVPCPVADDVAAVARAHGLVREPEPYPGLVLHPVPSPPALPEGLVIETARGGREGDFVEVVATLGLGTATADQLTSESFAGRDDVDLLVGYLDGTPAGTAVAIGSPRASGVVNVLTRPEARGRGVGTALTWAAALVGVSRGHDVVALQATPMGLGVYRAMGFETVVEYAEFT